MVKATIGFRANNITDSSCNFNRSHRLWAPDLAIFPRLPEGFRFMVGLELLKYLEGRSDEKVVVQFKHNPYESSRGKEVKHAVCDRGYRGKKKFGNSEVILSAAPLKWDNRYQRDKKRKCCRRRAAIEPIIGHLKLTLD